MLIKRISDAPDNNEESNLNFLGTICFWVTNIFDMPICFALLGLSLNLFFHLYENQTSLEAHGKYGMIQRRFPIIGITKSN